MNTAELTTAFPALMSELVYGAKPRGNFMLNGGDVGLLRALDELTAEEASQIVNGGSSIAAHVDHVAYYTHLMNRWAEGENLWHNADWTASWKRATVTEEEWKELRRSFASEMRQWIDVLKTPRNVRSESWRPWPPASRTSPITWARSAR